MLQNEPSAAQGLDVATMSDSWTLLGSEDEALAVDGDETEAGADALSVDEDDAAADVLSIEGDELDYVEAADAADAAKAAADAAKRPATRPATWSVVAAAATRPARRPVVAAAAVMLVLVAGAGAALAARPSSTPVAAEPVAFQPVFEPAEAERRLSIPRAVMSGANPRVSGAPNNCSPSSRWPFKSPVAENPAADY